MHRYKPPRSGLHACKYTYTKVQSANIDGRTPAQYSVRRVDEHEAITRFTRGNTLLTFTGERNPPNAPPRLIPARLVPIRKFYGKYDTWGECSTSTLPFGKHDISVLSRDNTRAEYDFPLLYNADTENV